MYFNSPYKVLLYVSCTLSLCVYPIVAKADLALDTADISVLPNTCVSLNKERKCYAKTKISWRAEKKGDYCISINANLIHIKCWRAVSEGEFNYEMSSKDNVVITLHTDTNDLILATTVIEVSWLYTGDSRKRRWRLF